METEKEFLIMNSRSLQNAIQERKFKATLQKMKIACIQNSFLLLDSWLYPKLRGHTKSKFYAKSHVKTLFFPWFIAAPIYFGVTPSLMSMPKCNKKNLFLGFLAAPKCCGVTVLMSALLRSIHRASLLQLAVRTKRWHQIRIRQPCFLPIQVWKLFHIFKKIQPFPHFKRIINLFQ